MPRRRPECRLPADAGSPPGVPGAGPLPLAGGAALQRRTDPPAEGDPGPRPASPPSVASLRAPSTPSAAPPSAAGPLVFRSVPAVESLLLSGDREPATSADASPGD